MLTKNFLQQCQLASNPDINQTLTKSFQRYQTSAKNLPSSNIW